MGRAGSWLICASLGLLFASQTVRAEAGEIITLGAAVSMTGKYAQNGANTRNGYDLAVKAINGKGGVTVGGRPYQLVIRYYDDESTPARGTELAERLIRQDKVKFMLGPYSSGLTKAILPIVEKYGVPMVEGNGAARELFTKGYRYIFAVLSTSDQYLTGAIQLAAENAHKLGKKPDQIRIALAMESDPFAQDVRAGVLDEAERYGMRIVIDDQLPPELNDMAVTLAKIKALKPDMLVVSGQEKGAITAVTQIKAMKVHVPIVAMTHCDSAELAEKFAEVSEHTLCAGQWHSELDYKDELFGTASDFAKSFKAAYGYEAPYQAAQSAASVQVFADAIARAQSLQAAKVRDALAATELQTFFGKVKFDESGRNIAKPMVLCQIRGGKYVIVAPRDWKKGEAVIPRPAD
jgi:branched-chain amino acid transport system substrate-binding protein